MQPYSLLGPFTRYEENEVLWIWPLIAHPEDKLSMKTFRIVIIVKNLILNIQLKQLGRFSIINNLIIIQLINIIIISGQSTVNFDSLCCGPRSRTRLNQKIHGKMVKVEQSKWMNELVNEWMNTWVKMFLSERWRRWWWPERDNHRQPWAKVIKLFTAVIYHHSTVMLSICVIKLYYLGNYCGMAVKYGSILTLEKVGLKLQW